MHVLHSSFASLRVIMQLQGFHEVSAPFHCAGMLQTCNGHTKSPVSETGKAEP